MNNKQNQNHKDDDNLLPKEFDGIQERNNPIPAWFSSIMYGSIIFAVVYLFMFHFMQYEQVASNRQIAQQNDAESASKNLVPPPVKVTKDWKSIIANSDSVKKGKEIYTQNCASCHGTNGQGGIGPNLTDNKWIADPTFESIYSVIYDGNLPKGMPAWGNVLGEGKTNELVAYLAGIQNTNVAGGKASEGTNSGPLH